MHPGLIPPPFPSGLEYLFSVIIVKDEKDREHVYLGGWFGELSAARTGNGFGINPVTYGEMKAWAELTGRHPTPLEVNALRRLDSAFLASQVKKDG